MRRRVRYQAMREDAADGCELYAIMPIPPWWCGCGTRNDGSDVACHYCGQPCEDADETPADEQWNEVLKP